jgi:WD40 repeat protein
LLTVIASFNARAEDKINYQDHILPLIEANCSKCHNADKKKADLDLTSYQGALQGSGSGPVLISGNPDGSKLWKAITHAEEPNMPPNRPRLPDKDLAIFKQWIAGGLLESANGKAVAAAKPALDLTLKSEASVKPDGPPPMPQELPLQPVQHGLRGNAILGLAASPWAPLVAVSDHEQLLLFNSETLAILGALPFPEGEPLDLKFSRNGKLLLAAGGRGAHSGRVALWDVINGKRLATLGQEYDSILAADIRADQSQVALGGPSRLVKVLATSSGELLHRLKKHTDWVTAVTFSPNSQMLASGDRNGAVIVWDPESGQDLFSLSGHKSAITALSWRDDSKLLASASEDGTIKVWEMKEGKQVKSWAAHNSGALSVSYSHTGQLVSCGRDGQVILWDGNGSKIRKLDFTGELPLRAVFSEDAKRIFTTDFNGAITAWNAADGKRVADLAETHQLAKAQ